MAIEDVSALLDGIVADLERDGWSARKNVIGREEIAALAHEARSRWRDGEFRPAGTGRGAERAVRAEIRSDHIHWIDPDDPSPQIRDYLAFIEHLRTAINQQWFLGLFNFEGHLAVYDAGAFYRRHLDCFREVLRRRVTVILYLNDADWAPDDGGTLRIYTNGESLEEFVDVVPEGGTLVTFFSDRFYHEVLPARRPRTSLTGWLCRRD